jgi:hypothetical protein
MSCKASSWSNVVQVFASLRSRVFVATAVVAVLSMGAVLGYVTARVTRQAEAELGRQLEEAMRIVDQHHRVRLETGRERALLMADVPMLKAAVATGDPPTVERLTRDYPERVGCDLFVVTDAEGRTLTALGGTLGDEARTTATPGFVVEGDRLLEFFEVPIVLGAEAPEILGELSLGFALDDTVAARLRSLTGSHVAIAYRGRVHATTLPRVHDPALLATPAGTGVLRLQLGGEDWVALGRSLVSESEGPSVLVLRSRAEALRPLDTLRTALAVAALVAVAASLLLSWAVARTVTRPLAALTDAMKEIAVTGDLTRKIGRGRALRPRPALHHRGPRGAQPADDHQGVAEEPAPGRSVGPRGPRVGRRHRPRGGSPRPHRRRRPRLRPPPADRAGPDRSGRGLSGCRRRRPGGSGGCAGPP